jgi:ParB family transcriptional regulator, chromosome partitioning protein
MKMLKILKLRDIIPDSNQPRRYYEESSLIELANSIEKLGVIQPITVRNYGNIHMIVCGERRFKASTIAGLQELPCIVKDYTDEEALEVHG